MTETFKPAIISILNLGFSLPITFFKRTYSFEIKLRFAPKLIKTIADF
jgi:hypothetical protein